jgi:hypothetical protein
MPSSKLPPPKPKLHKLPLMPPRKKLLTLLQPSLRPRKTPQMPLQPQPLQHPKPPLKQSR